MGRQLVGALALMLACGGALAPADAARAQRPGADVTTRLAPLAGSNTALVYADGYDGSYADALVVRFADGTEKRLTNLTATTYHPKHWSITQSTVTVQSGETKAAWWDVTADTNGVLTIPDRFSYVGAAPGGVMYLDESGRLVFEDYAGVATPWAQVFDGRPVHLVQAASSDVGVVMSDPRGGDIRYVKFNDPQIVTDIGPVGTYMCWSANARYAACTTHRTGRPDRGALIPLDGSKAMLGGDRRDHFGEVAITGKKTLVWNHDRIRHPYAGLGCRTKGHRHSRFGGGRVGAGPIRALGKVITSTPSGARLEIVTHCPKRKKLAPPVPITDTAIRVIDSVR